jgi:hypothetical protein
MFWLVYNKDIKIKKKKIKKEDVVCGRRATLGQLGGWSCPRGGGLL